MSSLLVGFGRGSVIEKLKHPKIPQGFGAQYALEPNRFEYSLSEFLDLALFGKTMSVGEKTYLFRQFIQEVRVRP